MKKDALTAWISDHALLRYIERVHEIPVDKLRQQLTDLVQPAVAVGATRYVSDGFTYVLQDGCLVTVIKGRSGNRRRE